MTTMCDIITVDGTPQLSFTIIQLNFSFGPLMMSLITFHNPGTFFSPLSFWLYRFLALVCSMAEARLGSLLMTVPFFKGNEAKKKTSVHFEAFLNVSRKVFALPPFACECPVWSYSIKCSQEIQFQMLSNPSFPVHHRASTLFERCSTVGHLDSACLVPWNWWSFSWGAGGEGCI